MQPTYLPWIGYFKLMSIVDIFVFLDDVQFDKRSWQQRNKISSINSDSQFLTMPAISKGLYDQKLNEVKISEPIINAQKHLKIIYYEYSKSPYFKEYYRDIEKIYIKHYKYLCELNIKLIEYLKLIFSIDTKIIKSSSLNVLKYKDEKLLNICEILNASNYISPKGSLNYLKDSQCFKKSNINVKIFDYEPKIYKNFRNHSYSYLSAIDVLFNFGKSSINIMNEAECSCHSLDFI